MTTSRSGYPDRPERDGARKDLKKRRANDRKNLHKHPRRPRGKGQALPTEGRRQSLTDIRKPKIYCESFLKIRDKKGRIIPFGFNPAQEEFYNIVREEHQKGKGVRIVLLKGRQMGFSTLIEGMFFAHSATSRNTSTLVMAHDDEASRNLFEMNKLFYESLPPQLSAQGISGGLSESTNLGLETLYHDRLLQNEKQRQRGIGDIEAQGSSNALGVLKDYTANAAERANTMASIGDFSGYKELGYTDEQIAALKAAWDAKHAPRYYDSGNVTLGGAAQNIFSKMVKYGDTQSEGIWGLAEQFYKSGKISPDEMKYLLDTFGH